MAEGVKVMESELVELFQAAKNAADGASSENDGSDEETRCLDALKELEEFPVNYQLLVSTQVGKHLKHLTKHPRKKIQSYAVNLIETWKNIILEETSLKKTANVKAEPAKSKTSEIATHITVEKVSTVENARAEKIEPDISPRPRKLAKIETHENGNSVKIASSKAPPKLTSMVKSTDPMRDKVRELLAEALSKVWSEADENSRAEVEAFDPVRVSVSVESAMFENWGKSNGAHKYKYRSVMFNMKDPNNQDFRRRVLTGELPPESICNLSPFEMASRQRQTENQEIEKKKLFDCEREGAPKATTDQFRCGRCRQRKCTYYQLQTRSADEPMTTFVTCVNCNNHWKFC